MGVVLSAAHKLCRRKPKPEQQQHAPTPSVPTRIPITSASLAFSTVAYRRINMRFVRPLSSREDRVAGSYDHTCMSTAPQRKRRRRIRDQFPCAH